MFRISARTKKRLFFAVALMCAIVLAAIAAANFFPDETWNALNSMQEIYTALFPPTPVPPNFAIIPSFPYTDPDGYAVLSAWKHSWAQEHVIVVRREIEPDPVLAEFRVSPGVSCLPSQFKSAYGEAMNDFASKWSQKWVLEDRFSPASQFVLVPESQAQQVPRVGVRGYFAFSAIGFSPDHRRAVLYVVHLLGSFGSGAMFLMQKNSKGKWLIIGNGNCGWIT